MTKTSGRVSFLGRHMLLFALVAACSDGGGGGSDGQPDATDATDTQGEVGRLEPGVELLRPLELAPDARVPEADPALVDVEVDGSNLRFTYDGPPEIELEVGQVIAGRGDGTGFLGRITSITPEDGGSVLVVQTEPAGVNEFIHDGHLRIQTPPGVETTFEPIGDAGVGTTEQALSGSAELDVTQGLGVDCIPPPLDDPDYEIFPVLVFTLGATIELEIDGGNLEFFEFSVDTGLDVGATLEATAPISRECDVDLISWLVLSGAGPIFRFELPDINFSIGIIPVYIKQYVEPIMRLEGSFDTELDELYAQGVAMFGVKVGVEYSNGSWSEIFEPRKEALLGFDEDPTGFGNVDVDLEMTAGARYLALFYGVAGPTFGAELGVRQQTTASPGTCSWDASLEVGVDVLVGVRAELFGNTLADYEERFNVLTEVIAEEGGRLDSSFGLDCDSLREDDPELCANELDDDYDGNVDCGDRDCVRPLGAEEWPCPTPNEASNALCTDGVDNDGDGLADCDDPECEYDPDARTPICAPPPEDTAAACADAIDNDGDELVDCADDDCDRPLLVADWPCSGLESTVLACSDRADNDDDRLIDCADPDCTFRPDEPQWPCDPPPEDSPETCVDNIDNDFDDDVDCDDPDCVRPLGVDAWPCSAPEDYALACADGVDNDDDDDVDCDDPDCENPGTDRWPCAAPPENTALACDDTVDNDFDELTDCLDPDCARPLGAQTWPCSAPEDNTAACADGADNDDDEATDCDDDGCAYTGVDPWPCPPEPENTAEACGDGDDNDFDDETDCDDLGCTRPIGVLEWPCTAPEDTAVTCADGADNDDDEATDCDDPGCAYTGVDPWPCPPEPENTAVTCGDGDDNDFDDDTDCDDDGCARPLGVTDWPCTAPENTAAACADGADNDDDEATDCDDEDCARPLGAESWPCFDTSESTVAFCSDGSDNDGDGLIDCWDPDCQAPPGAASWPCGGCGADVDVGLEGCCSGSQLIYCSGNSLVVEDCTAAPSCGWDDTRNLYNCNTPGVADPGGSYPLSCSGQIPCADARADIQAASGYAADVFATPVNQYDYQIISVGPVLPNGDLLVISRDDISHTGQVQVIAVHPDGSDSILVSSAQYPPFVDGPPEVGRFGEAIVLDPDNPSTRAYLIDRAAFAGGRFDGRLAEIDLTTGDTTVLVDAGTLDNPAGVAVHPITGDVYIADTADSTVDGDGTVWRFDGETLSPALTSVDAGSVAFLDDGTLLYVRLPERELFAWNGTDSTPVFPYAVGVYRGGGGSFGNDVYVRVPTQPFTSLWRMDTSTVPYQAVEEIIACGAAQGHVGSPAFGPNAVYTVKSNGNGGGDDWVVQIRPPCPECTAPCETGFCDPEGGCELVAEGGDCDDGLLCTGPGTCSSGECQEGPPADCDDGDACTDDFCEPSIGCYHSSLRLEVPLDDGDQPIGVYDVGGTPTRAAIGELTGDTDLDVAVSLLTSSDLLLFPGLGDGELDTPTNINDLGQVLNHVRVGDVDSDDELDDLILGVRNLQQLAVRRQNESSPGTFLASQTSNAGTFPFGLETTDLDGDGLTDAVVTYLTGDPPPALQVLLSDPANPGLFLAPDPYPLGSSAQSPAIGDIDGDMVPDIAVATRGDDTLTIYLQDPDNRGSFSLGASLSTGSLPDDVAIGDLDGDDLVDVVVTRPFANAIELFAQQPGDDLQFAPAEVIATSPLSLPGQPLIVDLDQDGRNEMIVGSGSTNGELLAYQRDPMERTLLLPPRRFPVYDDQPFYLELGDLDGDGYLDIVAINASSETISVVMNETLCR